MVIYGLFLENQKNFTIIYINTTIDMLSSHRKLIGGT